MIQLIEWIFESGQNFWKFIGFTAMLWFFIATLIALWQQDQRKE